MEVGWPSPLDEAECGPSAVLLHYNVRLEGSCLQLITSTRNSRITADREGSGSCVHTHTHTHQSFMVSVIQSFQV